MPQDAVVPICYFGKPQIFNHIKRLASQQLQQFDWIKKAEPGFTSQRVCCEDMFRFKQLEQTTNTLLNSGRQNRSCVRNLEFMNVIQLIYASRPFGFDNATLNAILIEARLSNPRHEITGALICRADIYLQLLEGPEIAVESTFARIVRDDRHLEVKVLYRMPAAKRLFPEWAMRDDPPKSWMWTKREVTDGVLLQAPPEDILKIFERLATEPN